MSITERVFSRRHLFRGLAAAAVSGGVAREVLSAQNAGTNPRRIDLHHHFGSPRWIKPASRAT